MKRQNHDLRLPVFEEYEFIAALLYEMLYFAEIHTLFLPFHTKRVNTLISIEKEYRLPRAVFLFMHERGIYLLRQCEDTFAWFQIAFAHCNGKKSGF
ncbi:MAG: hypothetical protein UY60_C0005G0033 [Parcubacteria group bacterium GW2011_GWB1_50_9]|nr:MAG: hypothetical protein UY60_C0005G0033 [Parcubacteria group bacterium GW2011_GWB1_50_9]